MTKLWRTHNGTLTLNLYIRGVLVALGVETSPAHVGLGTSVPPFSFTPSSTHCCYLKRTKMPKMINFKQHPLPCKKRQSLMVMTALQFLFGRNQTIQASCGLEKSLFSNQCQNTEPLNRLISSNT